MKHFKNLIIVTTSFILIGVACTPGGDPPTTSLLGNWVKRIGFDGNGRAGAVSFVIGDSAYVGTGFDGSDRYKDFWVYSPNTESWSQRALMPAAAAKRNSAAAFAASGKGYVTTGYDGINKLQDTWEFNPATNTWAQKANLPDPANSSVGSGARYGAVGFGIGTKGYICSGYTGSHTKDLWEYNPATDSWASKPSMNTSDKRTGAVAFVYNNQAYIVSGTNNGTVVTEMAMYDPATSTWTKKRDIANLSSEAYDDAYTSIVRGNAAAFVIGTKGYIATGENGANVRNTWEYDFATDTWSEKTGYERSDRTSAVGFAVKGRGFIALGRNSTFYFDNLDELKPTDSYNAND